MNQRGDRINGYISSYSNTYVRDVSENEEYIRKGIRMY